MRSANRLFRFASQLSIGMVSRLPQSGFRLVLGLYGSNSFGSPNSRSAIRGVFPSWLRQPYTNFGRGMEARSANAQRAESSKRPCG